MFVCHGNICRSPMAEFIFRDMVKKNGIEDQFLIASCATSREEIWNGVGNPVYPPAKAELKKHGITCDGKRAVQLKKSDYDQYDLFVCMDSNNIRNANQIFGRDMDKKIHRLLEFADSNADVADPWYSNRFDTAYKDIHLGCTSLLKSLKVENKIK